MITIDQALEFIKSGRTVTLSKNIQSIRKKMYYKGRIYPLTDLSSAIGQRFIILCMDINVNGYNCCRIRGKGFTKFIDNSLGYKKNIDQFLIPLDSVHARIRNKVKK